MKTYACKIVEADYREKALVKAEKDILDVVTSNRIAYMTQLRFYNEQRAFSMYGKDKYYFGFDLMSGDCDKYWRTHKGFTTRYNYALYFTRRVFYAMSKFHNLGYVHFDLKPANILVDNEGRPHVADFGMSKRVSYSTMQQGGTPLYMSPEAFSNSPVTKKADVWAVGCILYELVSGKRLYPYVRNQQDLANKVKTISGFERFGWTYENTRGKVDFKKMILDHMLVRETRRMTFDQLISTFFNFSEQAFIETGSNDNFLSFEEEYEPEFNILNQVHHLVDGEWVPKE